MKRIVLILIVIVLLAGLLWGGIGWIANGGWPGSGPIGGKLPAHIEYVKPADGEVVAEANGFCVHFNYQVAGGMDEDKRYAMRFYMDGINVSKQIQDIVMLEYGYPSPVGEPCFHRLELLRTGWHTAKVKYLDNLENPFEYTWRFYVVNPQ